MKNKFLMLLLSILLIPTIIMGCSTANKTNQDKANEFNELRQDHKTKLITEGPSPMKNRELTLLDNASEITYKSGNLSLKAWISKNHEEGKKYPAVVYLHGGFGFTEKNWEEAQAYSDAGFILMTPMLRGENGNPGNYELLYGEVDDLIAAAEYLAEQPYVDSDHIFLSGHSLGGGNAVIASMLPSKYNTVATFGAAPLDLKAELDANEKLKGIIPFDMSEPKEFELRTPVKYPQYVNKPLHMFVETESHLPEIQSTTQAFIGEVKENGMEAEYYSVEGDHFSSVDEAIKRSIEVFKGKLKDNNNQGLESGTEDYKNIGEAIENMQNQEDKKAIELAEEFRKALPHWEAETLKKLTSDSTYKKIEKYKKKISASKTQQIANEETKGIKVNLKDDDTITIKFDDFYKIDDSKKSNQIKVRLIHKITVDKKQLMVSDYSYTELL